MQTAVEWLINELGEYFPHEIGGIHLMVEQAKKMEKQQMFGFTNHHHVIGEGTERFFKEEFELWYNETYGSKGSDNLPKIENKDSFGEISEEDEKTNSQRFDEFMDLVKSSQTEISDEEIFKQSVLAMEERYGSGCNEEIDAHFRGAIWYKEQLKSK